jgi:hypothetical protein
MTTCRERSHAFRSTGLRKRSTCRRLESQLRHHGLAAVLFNARDRFINRIDTDRALKTKDWFAFNDFAPRLQRAVNAGSGRKF